MSRAFVESFFPAAVARVRQLHATGVVASPSAALPVRQRLLLLLVLLDVEILFPPDVAQLCPEVYAVLSNSTMTDHENGGARILLRNPVLCLYAVVGAAIGLGGGGWLLLRFLSLMSSCRGSTSSSSSKVVLLLWSIALLSFGLMNVVAVPLHCLAFFRDIDDDASNSSTTDDIYPVTHPWLWIMDNFFTGVSSTTIVLAWIGEVLGRTTSAGSATTTTTTMDVLLAVVLLVLWMDITAFVGGGAVVAFHTSTTKDAAAIITTTLPLELWYLLPTSVAAAVTLPLLWCEAFRMPPMQQEQRAQIGWSCMLFCTVAAVLIGGGIRLDATFCRSAGTYAPIFLDVFMAPTVVFGACDLAFWGLLHRQMLLLGPVPMTNRVAKLFEPKQKKR
jgi:hypothetical protein